MNGTQLYDSSSDKIYPISNADYISSGVIESNNTVKQDIEALFTKYRDVSGVNAVDGTLGIQVYYDTNNINDVKNVQSQPFRDEVMVSPTSEAPYAWAKTIYTWNGEEAKTVYTIIATALFPETQIMYAAFNTIQSGLQGPMNFADGSIDMQNNNIVWNTYFTGIDASNIYGYMATRHRNAGEQFPTRVDDETKPEWKIALFAIYPTTGESQQPTNI